MVDGINGANGIKPQDLTINWNDCTANEILEYKDEGQEVPDAILSWAEDMSKNQGMADEITYEMAMENPDQISAGNPDDTDTTAETTIPITEQAKNYISQSVEYNNSVESLTNDMETILTQAEETATNIEEYSNNLLSQIETLNAQKEQLQADKNSNYSAISAAQIENQIKELATLGLSSIETQAQNVYSSTNGINEAFDTSDMAKTVGSETINIGNEVLKLKDITSINIGNIAVSLGNHTINTANEGENIFNDTANENTANEDRVNTVKSTISNATGVFGTLTAENTDTENNAEDTTEDTTENEPSNEATQNATDKFEEDRANNKEEAEIDPTLADTTITTDPNEILKRKERRGLA